MKKNVYDVIEENARAVNKAGDSDSIILTVKDYKLLVEATNKTKFLETRLDAVGILLTQAKVLIEKMLKSERK